MVSATSRAIAGLLVVSSMVAAGLLVSPTATIEAAASLSADPVLFGLVVGGLYFVRPLFAWPTTPLAIVVGYGYGATAGVPIALLGVVATVTPVFLGVRWFSGTETAVDRPRETERTRIDRSPPADERATTVGRLVDRTLGAIDRYYATAGPLRGVIASRLAPVPSDVSTAAAAVSGVRLRLFVLGTAIGELPWTIAGVVVGASAATVTTGGLGEIGIALTVTCAVAAGLLLAGPAYRLVRTRRQARESGQRTES